MDRMQIGPGNPVVEDIVYRYLINEIGDTEHFNDFDSTMYVISRTKDRKYVQFGFSTQAFEDVMENGGQDMLEKKYSDLMHKECPILPDMKLTLSIDLSAIPYYKEIDDKCSKEEKKEIKSFNKKVIQDLDPIAESLAKRLSFLKRDFIGAPIEKAFLFLKDKKEDWKCQIKYRKDETFWVISTSTSISVIFGINFTDPTDQGLGRVLLLELEDAKKHLTTLKHPPEVKYFDLSVPQELESFEVDIKKFSNGFLSFNIFTNHVSGDYMKLLSFLVGFRQFLQYHLHAVKSYLHSKFRRKVTEYASMINEARRTTEKERSYKELIGGTTAATEEMMHGEEKQGQAFKYHGDQMTIGYV